jgi:peptidoglycan hydrolase-like protein with peptidoglycan-binding domain
MKLKPIVAVAAAILATSAFAGGEQYQQRQSRGSSDWGSTQRVSTQSESPQVVRQVQQELNAQGYDAGPANGQFTARTERGVSQFQASQNISPTGQIDQQTLAALGINEVDSTGGFGRAQGSYRGSSPWPDDPYRSGNRFDNHAPRD